MFGCASNTDDSIPVVGVAQIVSHTSLNTIRDSFSAQMEELGYIDGENIEINYADASNQQSNLNSIITSSKMMKVMLLLRLRRRQLRQQPMQPKQFQ